jgi:transposase
VAVPVVARPVPVELSTPPVMQIQARLPNGVAIELGGINVGHVGSVIEALGRLRCSGSTKA